MQQDKAAAEDTQPHVFALDRAPTLEQLAQLRRDLDSAVDSLNWQMRCNARLRGLLHACEAEGRAPNADEIAGAMAYVAERMAA